MAAEQYLLVGILIIGAGLAKFAEEYRFPYPLILIISGIVLGQLFPQQQIIESIPLEFIAQLTLAAVLFYAGLTLNIKELRLSLRSVLALATLGVFLTSIIAGFTIQFFVAEIGLAAFLIGAILSPTDPAALFSVLETGDIRVKRKLFSILEGEAVFNDATSVVLVLTVFEPLVVTVLQQEPAFILLEFVLSLGLGVLVGFGVAYGVGWLLHFTGEDTNIAILTAATPIVAYGIGELVSLILEGVNLPGVHPGAMVCVFTGIFMANAKKIGLEILPQKSMRGVMKNVSFAFEIVVFILLGFTLNVGFIATSPGTVISGIIVALLVIFVARPVSVFLVTSPDRNMGVRDRFFLSWAGVKGVASAALAAIAVSIITEHQVVGFEGLTNNISSIVFIVLMISLALQGLTTPILAQRLGLTEEVDLAEEIAAHRNATRHALLQLVDMFTEGKIPHDLYRLMKSELEEEIYSLEDELRRLVADKRAREQELEIRETVLTHKLTFLQTEYEAGRLSEPAFEDERRELEAEIEDVMMRLKLVREGKNV
ncbi:MAG: cation:proton antiporter [Candidatus Thorarchaeota archaeon]|nr:MAG: cation:proton antiporter [Candidatus Thorarchaeota archaeon]